MRVTNMIVSVWDQSNQTHTHTAYRKLLKTHSQTLNIGLPTWRQQTWNTSCRRQLRNVTNLSYATFLLQQGPRPESAQPPHHRHRPSSGPPSVGCMSLEVASDVSSSAGQSASPVGPWWMWSVWETVGCVWSARHKLNSARSNTSNDP